MATCITECVDTGDFQDSFLFRLYLLKQAQRIDFHSSNMDSAKFMLKENFTREQELGIKGGMQLFAVLEQMGKISMSNTTLLKDIMDVCHLNYVPFIKGAAPSSFSPKRYQFDANLDQDITLLCTPETRESLYKSCLIAVSNKLATADGSLQQLVYLCPEVNLCEMNSYCTGCNLFDALEAQKLISSSQLSYLYCRLCCLSRLDLAEEILAYIQKVHDRRSSLLRMHSDPGVCHGSDHTQGITSQNSFPNSITGRKISQPEKPLQNGSPFPLPSTSDPQGTCTAVVQKKSPSLDQPEMPVANGITSAAHPDDCRKRRRRSTKAPESAKFPTPSAANGEASICREPGLGSESQQDDSDASEADNVQHRRCLRHVSSLPAAFFKLFQLVLCIIFGRAGEVSNDTITVFQHPVYRMMYCLRQKTIKTMLVVVLTMVVLANFYKFLLEEQSCGRDTALLNLCSRLLTHTILPSYYLNYLWGIDNSLLDKLPFLKRAAKRDQYSRVLKRVVNELSTPEEVAELENKTVVEQVNILLHTKLSVVFRTSLLLSAVFFLQILLLRASNFDTFEASADCLSKVCVLVITLASFIVHCTSGVTCCLYLFEMRVKEYCAHILRAASKASCDLRQDVKVVRSTLSQRWKSFKWVVLVSSIVYLAVLCVRIASGTPFHCHGGRTEFAESEIDQIRAAWAFNITLGLFCHCLVYSYFNFLPGRRLAVFLQVIFLLISLVDSNGPKWAIVIQIANVVYPAASTLSLHLLACHTIFNRDEVGYNRNANFFWRFLAKLRSRFEFVFHLGLMLAHTVAILSAIYYEYESFAPKSPGK